MLDSELKQQLATYLEKITLSIELVASLDDSQASQELDSLLNEIASLSDKITRAADVKDEQYTPSFAIRRRGSDVQVRFAAIPLGHEFTSLVLALLQVGGHPVKVEPEIAEQIASIDGEFAFETFMSLSCHSCPDTVQALNAISVLNPNIKHIAVDGALFQDEVEARQVMAVPSVFLNGQPFDTGRMTIEQILSKIDTNSASRAAESISKKAPFDVLVIGGGPAGAAAAIYAARKGIRTGIVAERFGGQVLDTMSIENFISVEHTEGPKLAAAMESHVRSYDVDIMNSQRVAHITPAATAGDYATVTLANDATLKAKAIILAPGASWRQTGVPGEDDYRNKGVTYCPHCDGPLFKGKNVAVIGGGNSGIEAAIDLAGIVKHVTVLEFDNKLRADQVLQNKLNSMPNTHVILNAKTTEMFGTEAALQGLHYLDRTSNEHHTVDVEGIFVQIGLLPNTAWLKDTVKLTDRGEIVIDDAGKTSANGIFAAGDATTVPYKQIITAMGAGSTAALSAFDYLIRNSSADQSQANTSEAA